MKDDSASIKTHHALLAAMMAQLVVQEKLALQVAGAGRGNTGPGEAHKVFKELKKVLNEAAGLGMMAQVRGQGRYPC